MSFTTEECNALKHKLVNIKPDNIDVEWFYQLYEPLIEHVLDPATPDSCSAVDTLAIWLQRYVQLQRSTRSTRSNQTAAHSLPLKSIYLIFDYICEFWTDSGAALGNALREILQKLIAAVKVSQGDGAIDIYKEFVDKVLQFPRSMRIVYFGVEKLAKHVGGDYILGKDKQFLENGLCLMHHNGLANGISRALTAIYTYRDTEGQLLWIKPTISALLNDNEASPNIQQYFLASIFKSLPTAYEPFITELNAATSRGSTDNDDIKSLQILVNCIKIGMNLGIARGIIYKQENKDLLSRLLQHKSVDLRISGLGLLVAEKKETTPITETEIRLVKENFIRILGEVESGPRSKIMGLLRAFVARLKATAYSIAREEKRCAAAQAAGFTKTPKHTKVSIRAIHDFFEESLRFATSHLLPGTPHHVLSGALQYIEVLVRSGLDNSIDRKLLDKSHIDFPEAFNDIHIFSHLLIRLLVDSIINPYEDIRTLAAFILRMIPKATLQADQDVHLLKSKCQSLLDGSKGREADSAARLADLIYYLADDKSSEYLDELVTKLNKLCHTATTDLPTAVLKTPCHGYFSAISLILLSNPVPSNLESLKPALFDSLYQIWGATKDILTHESPEGNIPPEFAAYYTTELEKLHGPASQVILSFGWRSIKEASHLLDSLLIVLSEASLSDALLTKSGEFILEQLSVVKHRGAFSSIYPSFITCCRRCFGRGSLKNQPLKWLNHNTTIIRTSAHYITRRSSGLPFMISAVLTAVKEFDDADIDIGNKPIGKNNFEALFLLTFNQLLSIAVEPAAESTDKTELAQVHAMNCIRVMFTDAELTDVSSKFVDRALELSIGLFAHPIWSIRNCAVMLFTVLQSRIFGHRNDGFMSAKLFFMRYRSIRQILLSYMQGLDRPDQQIETIYPVLYLLVKLKGVSGYNGLKDFEPWVVSCLGNRIWKIREMASRVIGVMTVPEDAYNVAITLLESCSTSDQNRLHGHSLALQSLFPLLDSTLVDSVKRQHLTDLFSNKICPILQRNASSETHLAFFRAAVLYEKFDSVLTRQLILEPLPCEKHPVLSSSDRLYRAEAAAYAAEKIMRGSEYSVDEFVVYMISLLTDYAYEVKLVALRYIKINLQLVKGAPKEILSCLYTELWSIFVNYDWDSIRAPALSLLSEMSWLDSADKDLVEESWKSIYRSISENSTDIVNQACLKALGCATGQLMALATGHHFHYHPLHGHDSSKLEKALADNAHNHTPGHEAHEHSAKMAAADPHVFARVVIWLRTVAEHSVETEEFPTRLSALESLASCLTPKIISTASYRIESALLILFDFLSDDDYEIRNMAESVVQGLLEGVADKDNHYCQKVLLSYIASKSVSPVLNHLFKNGLRNELSNALAADNRLFTVEKENLYVNPVDYFELLLQAVGEDESVKESALREYESVQELVRERHSDLQELIDSSTEVYMICYKINRLAAYLKVPSPVQDVHPSLK